MCLWFSRALLLEEISLKIAGLVASMYTHPYLFDLELTETGLLVFVIGDVRMHMATWLTQHRAMWLTNFLLLAYRRLGKYDIEYIISECLQSFEYIR